MRPDRRVLVGATALAATAVVGVVVVTSEGPQEAPQWFAAAVPVKRVASFPASVSPSSAVAPSAAASSASAPADTTPAVADPWRESYPLGTTVESEIADVSEAEGGLIVAAGRQADTPAVAVSGDGGATWRTLAKEGLPAGAAARAVAADRQRVVMVVTTGAASTVWELRTSRWRQLTIDAPRRDIVVLSSVVLANGRLVVGGYASNGVGLWSERDGSLDQVASSSFEGSVDGGVVIFDVAADRDRMFAAGRAGDGAFRWVSRDGRDWARTKLPVDRSGTASFVNSSGEVVFGYDASGAVAWTIDAGTPTATRLPPGADSPQAPLFLASDAGVTILGVKAGGSRSCWLRTQARPGAFTPCKGALLENAAADLRAAVATPDGFFVAGTDRSVTRTGAVWEYEASG